MDELKPDLILDRVSQDTAASLFKDVEAKYYVEKFGFKESDSIISVVKSLGRRMQAI